MIQLEKELSKQALELTAFGKLKSKCPRCYGGFSGRLPADKPDVLVCLDCNFQQRRHKSASVELDAIQKSRPSLFLSEDHLTNWAQKPDPNRALSKLRSADGPHKQVGVIYDIGCNLEKGIIKILEGLWISEGRLPKYYAEQWNWQCQCQLELLGNHALQDLTAQLERLMDLEEKLRVSVQRLEELCNKRQRTCTKEENAKLASLPVNLVFLEVEINEVVVELRSEEFQEIPGASDEKGRALIQIRIAKFRLYKARVGIIDLQKRWDKPGLERVHKLDIEDCFWNFGNLTHPEEDWAVNLAMQAGIDAFLKLRSCTKELRRIGLEVFQVVDWSLGISVKLESLKTVCDAAWRSDDFDHCKPIEWVFGKSQVSKQIWDESTEVLASLHSSLLHKHCRLWINWGPDSMVDSLHQTCKYTDVPVEVYEELSQGWVRLVHGALAIWEVLVPCGQAADSLEVALENDDEIFFNEWEILLDNVIIDGDVF
ncbi:hypothetical protein DFH28DRAFT_929141 [Melampsora americana]|nr:hypothetical protein DFH28DRAFT_929141 [Melampsora americana]